MTVITNSKLISLAFIGLALGALIGLVADLALMRVIAWSVWLGDIGFLAGWIWKAHTAGSVWKWAE